MTFFINSPDIYADKNPSFTSNDIGSYSLIFPTRLGNVSKLPQYISNTSNDPNSIFPKLKDKESIQFPIDLDKSYNEWRKLMGSIKLEPENYDVSYPRVLDWVADKQFDIRNIDFVCGRGILSKVGHTLYDLRYHTPWQFRILKYNGVCYISDYPAFPNEMLEEGGFHKQASYWGTVFEDEVTSSQIQLELNPLENIGHYSVFTGNIGRYKYLYHSEVDAIDNSNKKIELKTSQIRKKSAESDTDFKNKLSKVWLQCNLGSVKKVVFGLTSNKGIVNFIDEYTTDRITTMCVNEWDPNVMMGFLSEVLDWALPLVEEKRSCVITYDGKSKKIEMTKKDDFYLPETFLNYIVNYNADNPVIESNSMLLNILGNEVYSKKITYFHTEVIGYFINYHKSRLGDYTEMAKYVPYDGEAVFPQLNNISAIEMPINLDKEYEEPCESWESLADEIISTVDEVYPSVLDWVMDKQFNMDCIDFVCSRGILKRIGCTLYDVFEEDWCYRIYKHRGICYFGDCSIEFKRKTAFNERCAYWGVIFEDNVTTQPKLPDEITSSAPQENFAYYSVTMNMIGKYKFLSNCEIDAIDPNTKETIELKTAEDPNNRDEKEAKFRRNKLSNVWLQSYLASIDKVIYGLRDRNGVITRFKEYYTADLPTVCCKEWSSVAMLRFIETVLDWTLPQIEEGMTYILHRQGKEISIAVTDEKFYLPKKYIDQILK